MAISDTQLLILSAASQRTDHAATLPANLKGSAAKKVIDRLLKQKMLQELRAKDDMPAFERLALFPSMRRWLPSVGDELHKPPPSVPLAPRLISR